MMDIILKEFNVVCAIVHVLHVMVQFRVIVYLVIKINPDFCLSNNASVSKVFSFMMANVYHAQ